ncbi:hypothetical protein Tco_0863980 [Tanacetum coccineum]
MSRSADQAQTHANFVFWNIAGKGSKQAVDGDSEYLPEDKLWEICEKHYNQILPIMTEKVHREKLQRVQTRLTYGESSHRNSRTREETQFSESESCNRRRRPKKRKASQAAAPKDTRPSHNTSVFSKIRREGDKLTRQRRPGSTTVFTRLGHRDGNVFTRLAERKRNVHSRLGPKVPPRRRHASEMRSAMNVKGRSKKNDTPLTTRAAGKLLGPKKLISSKMRMTRVDTGSPGLGNVVSKKTRMSANVKTYDGTGDPEDHLKIFQAAAEIELWAMPTWCYMFNSTLIGSARVRFDKLPPESIDNYELLRKAF